MRRRSEVNSPLSRVGPQAGKEIGSPQAPHPRRSHPWIHHQSVKAGRLGPGGNHRMGESSASPRAEARTRKATSDQPGWRGPEGPHAGRRRTPRCRWSSDGLRRQARPTACATRRRSGDSSPSSKNFSCTSRNRATENDGVVQLVRLPYRADLRIAADRRRRRRRPNRSRGRGMVRVG